MFEILLAVLIAWATITLVGHATWVILAGIVSFFTDNTESDNRTPEKRNTIAKSVIRELHAKGHIDASTMNQLFSAISDLGHRIHLKQQSQQDAVPPAATAASSSSNEDVTTTAAADTSSEVARKIRERFMKDVSKVIVKVLTPFRKETGQIGTNEDFKHLAKKVSADCPCEFSKNIYFLPP